VSGGAGHRQWDVSTPGPAAPHCPHRVALPPPCPAAAAAAAHDDNAAPFLAVVEVPGAPAAADDDVADGLAGGVAAQGACTEEAPDLWLAAQVQWW